MQCVRLLQEAIGPWLHCGQGMLLHPSLQQARLCSSSSSESRLHVCAHLHTCIGEHTNQRGAGIGTGRAWGGAATNTQQRL